MSKFKSDSYSFTTDTQDGYFKRVLDEVSPETNFLIVTESSTLTGATNMVLFAKKEAIDAIGEVYPNERLAGTELGDWIITNLGVSVFPGYYAAACGTFSREEGEEKADGVRSEINRLENILSGRILRVTVESR